MNAPERFSLDMTRFFRAPREKVFDAFVDESLMSRWQCPRGMNVVSCSADAREGGPWRTVMKSRDGTEFTLSGSYRQIRRPDHLSYTWMWESANSPMPQVETLIEIDFVPRDGGTELRMRHTGFPAAAAVAGHEQGWQSLFNRLNDLVDARGTAGTLTLLGDPRSSYVRTARMGLAEKGVAYTLQSALPRSPEVLAIHPFGRIPVLRDGEIGLWETSAILRYVDESFDSPVSLTPGRIADRVQSDQWVSAVNSYLYDTMVRRFILQLIFPGGDRAVVDGALAEMPAQIAALEKAYGRGNFLAGQNVSLADLFVTPILAVLAKLPESARLLAEAPNLQRAQAVMQQRASFTTTDPALAANKENA